MMRGLALRVGPYLAASSLHCRSDTQDNIGEWADSADETLALFAIYII